MSPATRYALLLAVGFSGIPHSASAALISMGLPNSSYSSSNNFGATLPSDAFDGSTTTGWNSGGDPTQWIEVNLGKVYSLQNMNLYGTMKPLGYVVHEIYTSLSPILNDLSQATLVKTIAESTGTDPNGGYPNWFISFTSPPDGQYVQVRTTNSPSWVAWQEIEIFDVPEIDGASATSALALLALGLALAKEGRGRRAQPVPGGH